MTNPEALQAITQIQEGLQRLQRVAPDLYATMGMPNIGVGMNLFGGGTGASAQGSTSGTTTTTTTTAGKFLLTAAKSLDSDTLMYSNTSDLVAMIQPANFSTYFGCGSFSVKLPHSKC